MSNTSHTHDFGIKKKTLSIYLSGFFMCIFLTLIPFITVINNSLTTAYLFGIVFISAILQFLVQVTCFLRLHSQSLQGKINLIVFFFTIFVSLIVICGSIWIMTNLNYFMAH